MNKRRKGASLVELGAGAIVLVPIFLYGLDYASIFLAQQFGTNVCRDAARAAAAGPPTMYCINGSSDAHRPRMRAKQVIDRSSNSASTIRVEPNFKFYEHLDPPLPQAPFGGPVNGWVRVRTTAGLNPPFQLPMGPKYVAIDQELTFPITWVMSADYATTIDGGPGFAKTRALSVDSD